MQYGSIPPEDTKNEERLERQDKTNTYERRQEIGRIRIKDIFHLHVPGQRRRKADPSLSLSVSDAAARSGTAGAAPGDPRTYRSL